MKTSRAGYSIIKQRDIDEIFINSYNIEWLRAWNANLDIQIVLDYFAVITYVTDYYSKDDTGTMEVIKSALEQAKSDDLKEKMKIVSNAFLTHRQMGEAEAIYKLIPSMTLKHSNVTCQWVSLGRKEERSKRWMRASDEDSKSGKLLISIKDHEGLWYEQQDMWMKYLRRPMDKLRDLCFAQFAKMYTSATKLKKDEENICNNEDERNQISDQEDCTESQDENDCNEGDDKFHYIIYSNQNISYSLLDA